jgi:hypothetical protein
VSRGTAFLRSLAQPFETCKEESFIRTQRQTDAPAELLAI